MPSLAQVHLRLHGTEASPRALKLYEAYETQGVRGYDARTLQPDEFQASLTVALYQGSLEHRVLLLVPLTQKDQVLAQLRNEARKLIRARKNSAEDIQMVRTMFNLLLIQSRLLQFPTEPQRWVSLGFCSEDPLPEWMKGCLLGP